MRWCPKCGSEYRQDIKACPDCELPLRDAPLLKDMGIDPDLVRKDYDIGKEYVVVYTASDNSQAEMIRDLLVDNDIPAMIKDQMGAMRHLYGSVSSFSGGNFEIIVLKKHIEQAEKVIKENLEWSEGELTEQLERQGKLSDDPDDELDDEYLP